MSKTFMTVFHIKDNYSLGFHSCGNAPEIYCQQSAGDIYNCLARYKKIIKTDTVVDILGLSLKINLTHVVPDGNYIDEWKSNLKLSDFLDAKVDVIQVVHENYKILHYFPRLETTNLEKAERESFYDQYKSIINKKIITDSDDNLYNVKCLIWKVIKDEQRVEKNKKYLKLKLIFNECEMGHNHQIH